MSNDTQMHTPGPWHVSGNARKIWITAGERMETIICDIRDNGWASPGKISDTSEAHAMAILIAVAPRLLDALRKISFSLEEQGFNELSYCRTIARDAIALTERSTQ